MTPIARPPSQPRANPPLRLDSVTIARRSLDISPSRSSVQSSRTHTPSSSVPSTPITSARAPSPEKKPLHPEDSNTFLTALAAQERRVLELKEELQKAEGELEVLKKQWASHEAAKKRNELRHLEQLQPLKVSSEGLPVAQGHDLKLSLQEQSRRKMAPPPVKSLQRTVFSGSRHARTLSLLSPKDSLPGSSFLLPSNGVTTRDRHIGDDSIVVKESSEQGNSNSRPNDSNGHDRGPPKDMILETGKQLVGDFRQGLWTFFEDLKQVTVGDEAANASDLRHQRTLPVESLPKAQIKRERGVDSKKGSAKDSTTLKREDSTRRQKAESSLHHDRVKSQQRAQLAPHSVPKSDPALLKDDDVLSDSDGGDECRYLPIELLSLDSIRIYVLHGKVTIFLEAHICSRHLSRRYRYFV